jgi:nucleotide-binding universal stress UspA family protein
VDEAARLAKEGGASVRVFSLARIWGTNLGLPMPGLLPTKREWDEQRRVVSEAVAALRRCGIQSEGRVVATRKGSKRIVAEAERLGCAAIVMSADPDRHWLVGDFMWSQEPQRVRRRAKVPVHLVEEPDRK